MEALAGTGTGTGRNPTKCMWRRFWAQVLDAVIVIGSVLTVYTVTGVIYVDLSDRVVMPAGWLGILGLWAVWIAYGTLFEALSTRGSPGKLAFGVRVVDRSGSAKITPWQAFMRNLMRIPDEFLVVPAGLFVAWGSVGRRRMGDMAARTLVVKESAAGAGMQTPWTPHEAVVEPDRC